MARIIPLLTKPFVALWLLLSLVVCHADLEVLAQKEARVLPRTPFVIGHRGAAGLAPENTLASFSRALEIGVDAIELDVHLTRDQVIVVYHDYLLRPEITRTPRGEWLDVWSSHPVKDLSVTQLKTYDVGRLKPHTSYSNRYPDQQPVDGERIPTLREVISLLKGHDNNKTELWIEIKTSPEKPGLSQSPERVAEAVARILRKEDLISRAKILSFDWRALVHLQKIAPEIPTVYLSHEGIHLNNIKPGQPGVSPWTAGLDVDDFGGSIPRLIKSAGGQYWAPSYKTLSSSQLQEAHDLGIRVFVWTPDKREDMIRLMEMGVDGIITNRPDILRAILGGS